MGRSRRSIFWITSCLVAAVALLSGWWLSGGKYTRQILALKLADPARDAAAAAASGDTRYVGVMGVGLMVPGVPDWWKVTAYTNVRVIPNTSDFIESPQHRWLQSVARDYAEQYNRAMVNYLVSRPSAPASRSGSGEIMRVHGVPGAD